MDVDALQDRGAARIAAAIADPARARMLYCLMDGHARTCAELAAVADVSASTTSTHLGRLRAARLITVVAQGKHRYHRLAGGEVARVLEGLNVLAGGAVRPFEPRTPERLRAARTCYDHLAGEIAVKLHDRLRALDLLAGDDGTYELTAAGEETLAALGIDVAATRTLRRRFAFACLDWSERRAHLGGALGAAMLKLALSRHWVVGDLDSRALEVTARGRSDLATHFGVEV
jgi:DNA-binding transcriptional ArsR family regulator